MEQGLVIKETEHFVRKTLEGEGSGHDWWHVYKVWKNAVYIGEKEQVNLYVVQLAALLHDIADWKFYGDDETVGPRVAREHLQAFGVEEDVILHVCTIIKHLSFKGVGAEKPMSTIEGNVVRDADRLEALGAIGIARCFAYGGYKGRAIYLPEVKPQLHMTFEAYKKNQSSGINHFYEKLLLLKDLMCTETGKQLALRRHLFMESYLKQFFHEWDGKS